MSKETAQPYLTADFGEQGGRYEWKTNEEAIDWLSKLRRDWEWIVQLRMSQTNKVYESVNRACENIINNLQQALNLHKQNNPAQEQIQITQARTSLEGYFKPLAWLLPNNAQRRFVEELRDSGSSLEAAIIAAHWMKADLTGLPIHSIVTGLLQWELYSRGIKGRMNTEDAALKKLAGDMQSSLTHYQEAEREQTHRFDGLHDKVTLQATNQQSVFDQAQDERSETWQKLFEDTKTELSNLKETYDKHMSLAAPVEYWEGKRKKHKKLAWGSFAAIIIGMGAAAYFLHTELQTVGQAIAANNAVAAQAPAAGASAIKTVADSATAWHLGSFILLATLSFWFIRLLVRIFLSNLHLENDAAERVTMAKTYLALIRDGSLPKGDNISTVLAALFRPGGDGIVKDEGVPPSTLEWFTKLGR